LYSLPSNKTYLSIIMQYEKRIYLKLNNNIKTFDFR
jgi:hypothetical protein